ncbi:hypothetical protein ACQ4PT_053746 [Festuca glaucescens]
MRNTLLFTVAIVAIYAMAVLGAGSPIDTNNPDIQWLGQWAVAVHVHQAHDGIKFNKVLRAELDEESPLGKTLYLLIDATNRDGKDAKYEAVLNQRAASRRALVSFKPAN